MAWRSGSCRRWRIIAAYILGMSAKDRLNDKYARDCETYAPLRALDPELPDHAWRIILRYRGQMPSVQWEAVREFTITNAVLMRPRTYENARRIMCMSARFAAWVWTVAGGEMTVERVYTQRNISRYLQECMRDRSESHRWGLVRQLGTIAETLNATIAIRRLPAPHLPGRTPFTEDELGVLHSWAMTLRTPLQRQNAWAILGLAGGAGLRSHEIVETRLGDIETTPSGLIITVRGHRDHPARHVPVMRPWDRILRRSIEGRTDPDEFVFRGYRWDEYRPRAIQTFLTDYPCRIRPTVSRLRSTWIVTHLNNGASLTVIMAIAGFVSTASLDRHLIHAAPPSVDDYFASLIGGEKVR